MDGTGHIELSSVTSTLHQSHCSTIPVECPQRFTAQFTFCLVFTKG